MICFIFLLRASIKEKIRHEVEMGGVYGGISHTPGLEVIHVWSTYWSKQNCSVDCIVTAPFFNFET